MKQHELAKWLLRIGLAFVFVYAAVEVYAHPDNFLKYIPKIMLNQISLDLFLALFGISEIVIAVWLLSGWKGVYPALISVLMMIGIVVFNMEYFQILFRNIAIGFGGLALVALEMTKNNEKNKKIMHTRKA